MKKYFEVRGGVGDLTKADEHIRVQDNLYLAVNSKWQKQAVIPADRTETGTNAKIDIKLEKLMIQDFDNFATGKKELPEVKNFEKAVKLYKLALDFDKRNKEAAQPIQEDLNKLEKIAGFIDFNKNAHNFYFKYSLPFSFEVDADMKNTDDNVLYFSGPGTLLPDTTSYLDSDADKLLGILKTQTIKLLTMAGMSNEEATHEVELGLKYDARLAKVVKSTEEWSDYPKMYNPIAIEDFLEKFKSFDMQRFLKQVLPELPEKIIITEPRYLDHIDEFVNEDSFEEMKGWMLIKLINSAANLLSQEFRTVAFSYRQAITGANELPNAQKHAYRLADGVFDEVDGIYYGKTYFGKAAKEDVTNMIHTMINVYENRIKNNTWLSESTKKKAIIKLNSLVLKIGYPEKQEKIYDLLQVYLDKSLYENMSLISETEIKYNFAKLTSKVDRSVWLMPANMNNACYDPQRNDITFPAGILQAPFYSLKQTRAENYGGIGATIAHEISHAFDNNGAQFDEKGNMNNWWSKEDFNEFEKRTQKAIDIYDGLQYGPSKLNGKQIVAENIADLGGLTCAIQSCKIEKGDLSQLFENYAKSWAQIQRPEAIKTEIAVDVHAPQPTRVNIPAQCQDEFYEVFNVKETDGMWLEPDKRVTIW